MNADARGALSERLLAFADDELVLGHRDGEWTGHAPILEEDIALANLAQDELGHAQLLYELRAELEPGDGGTRDPARDPDRLVFFRDAPDWRNATLLELPRGDWAFTMVRRFLFDGYEASVYGARNLTSYAPLADVAALVAREERFHLQHSSLWLERLGLGTEESHARSQRALDELWPHAHALFDPLDGDALLERDGILPSLEELRGAWLERTRAALARANLRPPASPEVGSRTVHTPHLSAMLEEMQSVARLEPEATW